VVRDVSLPSKLRFCFNEICDGEYVASICTRKKTLLDHGVSFANWQQCVAVFSILKGHNAEPPNQGGLYFVWMPARRFILQLTGTITDSSRTNATEQDAAVLYITGKFFVDRSDSDEQASSNIRICPASRNESASYIAEHKMIIAFDFT